LASCLLRPKGSEAVQITNDGIHGGSPYLNSRLLFNAGFVKFAIGFTISVCGTDPSVRPASRDRPVLPPDTKDFLPTLQAPVRSRGRDALQVNEEMRSYTLDEIRLCFSRSTDFNEIFDAFQSALARKLRDLDHYRLLFWNHALTTDEIRLFGEKLAGEFPDMAYDVYIWLASVFEVTSSTQDNYELALHYYKKAAGSSPRNPEPYLDACDCYDLDLNIPPVTALIEFVTNGLAHVKNPVPLYKRLSNLYAYTGDHEQSEHYRRKAEEGGSREAAPGS